MTATAPHPSLPSQHSAKPRRRHPPLTRLTDAQRDLVDANRGLIMQVIRQHWPALPHADYFNACQDGALGLMRAAQQFDPALGHRFSTLACRVIYWTILNVRNRNRNRGVHRRAQLLTFTDAEYSGERFPNGDGEARREANSSPACGLDPDERDALNAAMDVLIARERAVIDLRHRAGYTLVQAGRALSLSKSRVWQIEQRALARLAIALRKLGHAPTCVSAVLGALVPWWLGNP